MTWQGYQVITFEWCMVAMTFAMVAIRVYVQVMFRHRPWRELFVIMAWLLFLGVAICDSLMNDWGGFNVINPLPEEATDEEMAPLMKVQYAEALLYKPSIYCCKAALLCFFTDLSPKGLYPKTYYTVMGTWFFLVAGFVTHICYALLGCWPFYLNWSWNDGMCGYTTEYFAVTWSFHLFTDLLVYSIPFFILFNLKNIDISQKIGACIMFGLGSLNVLCAASIMSLQLILLDGDGESGALAFLAVVQEVTAVVIVCVPQIRTFVRSCVARRKRGGGGILEISAGTAGETEKGGRSALTGTSTVFDSSEVLNNNPTGPLGSGWTDVDINIDEERPQLATLKLTGCMVREGEVRVEVIRSPVHAAPIVRNDDLFARLNRETQQKNRLSVDQPGESSGTKSKRNSYHSAKSSLSSFMDWH